MASEKLLFLGELTDKILLSYELLLVSLRLLSLLLLLIFNFKFFGLIKLSDETLILSASAS